MVSSSTFKTSFSNLFLAPRAGFVEDNFSTDQGGQGDDFRMVLIRSMQPRFLALTVGLMLL